MKQLELHKKITEFFKAGVEVANVQTSASLLANEDAKRFFFSQADELWLGWLWSNGFLNGIKNKSDDATSYSYRLPELEYLVRMVEKDPAKVAQIIASVEISETNFNPEVIDRFIWILGSLPSQQIKTLTAKIRDEKWVYLMRSFRKSGYELERIVKKLVEKNENDSILELAQSILAIRTKPEVSESGNFNMEDPFFVADLDATGIFEALADIDQPYKERALQFTTATLASIIKLSPLDDSKVFEYTDLFSLYDVDLFTLEIENKHGYSYRDDIKNLAATIKKLIEETIGKKCDSSADAKRLFNYIDKLPTCRAMWRLKLFALVQCPDIFKDELKNAFFKLFEVENYYEIEGGAEYKKALKIGFPHLSNIDQRAYVDQVLIYFSQKDKEDPDQGWHKRTGWEILSSIYSYLKENELQKCEEIFDRKADEKYEPKSSISEMRSGSINHLSPVNLTDFTVEQIALNLKSEWTPEKLNEKYKEDDSFNPRGTEGLGDSLKEDIKKRTDEYLNKITLFFDRESIHPMYVYSLLRGIEEMLRNKQTLTLAQIEQVIKLFGLIMDSGKKIVFRRKDNSSWLADWIEVHKVMADILLNISEDKEKRASIHETFRKQIKNLISYLLTIKDSPSKDDEKPKYGEPYHIAINSVRGRAYEAFVVFTENDGKTLAEDVKDSYKDALMDDSLAVRFVIGRYLATFYFRDKDFIAGLIPEIFPKDDTSKKDIYLASWEGYLSNTLYDKLFAELNDYYNHAISLDPKNYTERKYTKGLDESLAIHIALAFLHLGLKISDPLFMHFWDTPNVTRHKEFISFIGRSCLTRDQAGDEWLTKNKVNKEKIYEFWDWALDNVSEQEALAGFGFWMNPNKEVLDDAVVIDKMAQTLKKSNGKIDWDYGLMRRLPTLSEKNAEKTLEVIQNYLLDSEGNLNQNRRVPLFSIDDEIKQSLNLIYKNGDIAMKQRVTDLVNILVEKGSSIFWGLKEVIN